MRISRLLPALTVTVLVSACGGSGSGGGNTNPGSPPPTNTISGKVTYNGAPLAGVTVVAFSTNSNSTYATTTTDASGAYQFNGLGTSCTDSCVANYNFLAFKNGYAFVPVLESDPAGSRGGYLWNTSGKAWYVGSGASVTRADFTGQFGVAGGGAGIYFSVVNLDSTPDNSIVGADFIAYDAGNAPVRLAASGQTVSYATGDDGDLKSGVSWPLTRFVDNQDGTITDELTGLVWLKDAGCFAAEIWRSAIDDVNGLASGHCGLTDGSAAGDWRLPNVVELESLIDASAANPAVSGPFSNVSSGIYWTATAYYGGEAGSSNAWAIRMSDGRYINDSSSNVMASSANDVWAVKSGSGGRVKLQSSGMYVPYADNDDGAVESGVPQPSSRMIDNGDGTVTDALTGLIWLKQADCISGTWNSAMATVNSLASGQCGLKDGSKPGDWHMPNRKEMQSLQDRAQNNHALYFDESFPSATRGLPTQDAAFNNLVELQYYWTSTTDAADTAEAWSVYSCDFGVYDTVKTATGYTLAVR